MMMLAQAMGMGMPGMIVLTVIIGGIVLATLAGLVALLVWALRRM